MTTARLRDLADRLRPLSQLEHPREVIRQFTPNWFAATMGTGVLALALPQVPGAPDVFRQIGEALWLADIALFVLFSLLYGARWLLFWREARRIFGHSLVSMFIGTIPMGLATLINGALVFGLPRWGQEVVPVAYWLWWVDVVLALGCGVLIPYLMFTRQEHRIDQMTAVWLLPVVAAEVAAVTGALLVPHLAGSAEQFGTLLVSYVLWAYSVPVACAILVILVLRMALHKLPPASMAASSWLALGPIGTGALGLLLLGAEAPDILAAHHLAGVGAVAAGFGALTALLLWGFGLWWLFLALLVSLRYLRAGVPFNLGWWGYTFPLGVYSLATLKLGAVFQTGFFGQFGTLLVAMLALMWLLVSLRTLHGGWKGNLFVSPCIAVPA